MELVGVQPQLSVDTAPLKRYLVIFSRLAVSHIEGIIDGMRRRGGDAPCKDLAWLVDRGIIFDPGDPLESGIADEEYRLDYERFKRHQRGVLSEIDDQFNALKREAQSADDFLVTLRNLRDSFDFMRSVSINQLDEWQARLISLMLRYNNGVQAYPLLSGQYGLPSFATDSRAGVLRVVIRALPEPAEDVPWEQILEFRDDPKTRTRFLELRNWMSEVARASLSPREVEEKLEYLLDKYSRHMDLHKMKTTVGVLETTVVTAAELLEGVAALRLSAVRAAGRSHRAAGPSTDQWRRVR